MVAESNHNLELLLAPDAVELLEDASAIHDVFADLAKQAGSLDLIETTDGTLMRHDLDTTVSYEGMRVISEIATDDTMDEDIQNLCQAILKVAEPCDEGSLLMEIRDDGEFHEVHAFDPDANLMDELDDNEPGDIEQRERFGNALESFIDDHYDPE